jgi:hypothetical protein
MQYFRDYMGPAVDDYSNVLALNVAFLNATSGLKGPQRGRLAEAPFLLFSVREREIPWWDRALGDQVQEDLLAEPQIKTTDLQQIQYSAVSFLSNLTRRNPYATRLVSGATIGWCATIRAIPLMTLMDRVATRDDLLVSRIDPSTAAGSRLLANGTSSKPGLRRYAHLCALQTLLTDSHKTSGLPLSAAACDMTGPLRTMTKKV